MPERSSPYSKKSLLQRTGVTEGFYRRWGAGSKLLPDRPAGPTGRSFSAPVATSTMERSDVVNDVPAANASAPASSTSTTTTRPTTTTGMRSSAPAATMGGGTLMAPGELGRQLSQTDSFKQRQAEASNPRIMAHPATIRARQRTVNAIRRSQQRQQEAQQEQAQKAVAAAAEVPKKQQPRQASSSSKSYSKVTAFCYHGMEVLFGTTDTPRVACYGMCARTRLIFQRLDLASEDKPILSLLSCPITGQIVLSQQDGSVQTFYPKPTDPTDTAFGRYRWYNNSGGVIHCAEIFYPPQQAPKDILTLDLSLSQNFRLLIAHERQLAVLDTRPPLSSSSSSRADDDNNDKTANGGQAISSSSADLLWTTRLPGKVVTAKLSGDGEAIALVMDRENGEEEDDDDAGADGVHTFERDYDDGSNLNNNSDNEKKQAKMPEPSSLARSRSVGIIYRPGPFLVHSAPVTRLAFRGCGHNTSNVSHKKREQGSDLLLTYCAENCAGRIFDQNHWIPLTEWITPQHTRVDWVRGLSAFTLGDLESQKKPKTSSSPSSAPPSRRPSSNSLQDQDSAMFNESLGKRQHYQSIPSHASPSSNSGAWISELTFQGPTPALRLSRLTYLKRGVDDLNPTLFENVSSFLPQGLVLQEEILGSNEASLSVEGIWPAWNPWLSETVEGVANETLRGSAMAFLGLSAGPGVPGGGHFGDSLLGSTQSPPSELRIVASHPTTGKLVVLEFPLLGDQDWTSLELGNPRKSVLALLDVDNMSEVRRPCDRIQSASIDYEASRLVAKVQKSSSAVSVTWRKQGSLSLLPSTWTPEDVDPPKAAAVLSEKRWFKDESLVPVPLSLPSVRLPQDLSENESIISVIWWPDESFGGPPLLVAVTTSGTIVVFELPPPWSSQEPVEFRNDDEPFPESPIGVPSGVRVGSFMGAPNPADNGEKTYEVAIVPDPEYGLGLRLEVQTDGMPAVAGSFKRHPLNGDILPAEKAGVISLGDELVSANDVTLEGKLFDDIIATVRDLGGACGPGNPMRLKFRRKIEQPLQRRASDSPGRRTVEEIIGIRPKDDVRDDQDGISEKPAQAQDVETERSSVRGSALKADSGVRDDFGSVVAVFNNAIPGLQAESSDYRPVFSLLSCSLPDSQTLDGVERTSLLIYSLGKKICFLLLVLDAAQSREKARIVNVGSWEIPHAKCESDAWFSGVDVIKSDDGSFCVVTCDNRGMVRLVFTSVNTEASGSDPTLVFRHYEIFRLRGPTAENLVLRACTVGLIATLQTGEKGLSEEITVWSARPHPGCTLTEPDRDSDIISEYASSRLMAGSVSIDDGFLDFAFLYSGFLDSSPSIVAFTRRNATMFTKQGGNPEWLPTIQVTYNGIPGSILPASCRGQNPAAFLLPVDADPRSAFPHIVHAIQLAYSSADESDFLRTDWDPESVLSYVCTDERGAEFAIDHQVRYLFLWLCSEGREIPEDYLDGPLVVAPLPILDGTENADDENASESTRDLMASLSLPQSEDDETACLRKLHSVLSSRCSMKSVGSPRGNRNQSAPENSDVEIDLPPILASMGIEDTHILRAFCDLLVNSPVFSSVDAPGQHFIFSVALLRSILSFSNDEAQTIDRPTAFSAPQVLVKTRSFVKHTDEPDGTPVASAGCLAAVLSNSQSRIIEHSRQSNHTFDWTSARELRIPFWLRSDVALARMSEEIGQNEFKENRNILECALFFIIARNTRTLRNLAATDYTDSGKTFFKFLTSHDFSSERGRRAAEKNAFSLLRKCRYRAAAAFFLLAEPPCLTSALETIVTKLKDMDLAFLVARLMESSQLGSNSISGPGLGGFGSGGGVLGGGGGYAGSGISQDTPLLGDEVKFEEWRPRLGKETRKLLIMRILPLSAEDYVLSAVLLLWLGKKEESSWCLSGLLDATYGKETVYSVTTGLSYRIFGREDWRASDSGPLVRAARKTNAIIDFVSAPFLLKAMRSSSRARYASTLVISDALAVRGVELPAIRTILRYTDSFDPEEKENISSDKSEVSGEAGDARPHKQGTVVASSMREGSSRPGPQPDQDRASNSKVESSIFDSYNVPTQSRNAEMSEM